MPDSSTQWLLGNKSVPNEENFSTDIAFRDQKICFAVEHCMDKDVLDLGCVQHNPENYKSKYWLHKALAQVSKSLEGLDLFEEGVDYLRRRGYQIRVGNAENFNLGKQYDVIVAGDIIEHLENLSGFLMSCRTHMRAHGKLLISTPNPWYWKNIVKAIIFGNVRNNPEHTLWICPITLGQLVARHNMHIEKYSFGSRHLRDRLLPLPKQIKHANFFAVVVCSS